MEQTIKVCGTNAGISGIIGYGETWEGTEIEKEQDFYRDVGRRVRETRKKIGMTQKFLASRVSLSRASVTNLEMGRQKLMLHTLVDIATELRVAPDDLIPRPKAQSPSPLDDLLKDRPETEQAWIGPALSSFLPEDRTVS